MEMSNPDKDSVEYRLWLEDHAPKCRKNFEQSSNAMEAQGAVVLWKRSIEKNKLR